MWSYPSLCTLSLAALLGCSATRSNRVPALASATPAADLVSLTLRLPNNEAVRGSLITMAFSPEEVDAGVPEAPAQFVSNLGRVEVQHDRAAAQGVLRASVAVPRRPTVLRVIFDTRGEGLDAVFGPRPGSYLGEVRVDTGATRAETTLAGRPYEEPPEACNGPRTALVTLDDPATRTTSDAGTRRLCVFLPRSYESSPARRYPVVYAFPGFSGWHARGDAWQQRELFDSEGEALGVEVIVVGVGTRTPEGSSYLQRSSRFGDWDGFVASRMVAAIDGRFRTLPRRGTIGHSTGGWNALAAALHHSDVFSVATASSPDAPDLDAWMLDGDAMQPAWLTWLRAEARLGGRGQFASYAAAWSPEASAPRGFAWPVDLASGALVPAVYDSWRRASLAAELRTDAGLRQARALSGRIAITTGRSDEFALFTPSERYATALRAAGVETAWIPTALGHFGHGPERFTPLVRFLLERLRG